MWKKVKFLINEFRSRKVFRTWLFSYLVLLTVSIAAGLLLYGFALRYVREETDRTQYRSLAQMVSSVDTAVSSASETAFAVINDKKVTALKKNKTYTTREYASIKKLADELVGLENADKNIDKIYISFNESGYLLSDSLWYQPDWCKKQLARTLGFELEDWHEAVSRQNGNGLYINQKGKETWIYYMISWAVKKGDNPEASVLVYLKKDRIRELIAGTDSQTWLVAQGETYFSPAGGELEASVLQFVGEAKQPYEVMKSRDYYIKKLTSDAYGYTLVHVIPKEGYLKTVNLFRLVLYMYLAFSLLSGGLIAFYLTKYHYSAVERLLAIVHKSRSDSRAESEFQLIETAICQLEQKNQRLNQDQDRKEAALKMFQMSAVLKGRRPSVETEGETYGALGRLSETRDYLLVGFELEPEREAETEPDWIDLLYFMMGNVCEEVYGEHMACYSAETDGLCMNLLALPENYGTEQAMEEVIRKTELICTFFKEKAATNLTGNITEIGRGAEAPRLLYGQIQEMIRFREWIGTKKQILTWKDLRQWQDEDQQQEYLLCREIESLLGQRDYQKISSLLAEAGKGKKPAGETSQKEKASGGLPPVSAGGSNAELMAQILAYMKEHFTEPDLNVNRLAEQFRISQSNLSQIFKRYYGMGPLEYIHRLRLELAKEYLAGKDSVVQIAEKVGYYSTRPLIRCFKQYEGKTPSEYREWQAKNGLA